MKKRVKSNQESAITKQQIKDFFPQTEPWILFLGTSHTHGSCEIGEFHELEDHERYTGILKTKFPNYKIVNMAIGGNNNSVMLQQLCDAFDCGVMKNCKMVIVESRHGDPAGEFCTDTWRDFNIEDRMNVNTLAGGSDLGYITAREQMITHYATGDKVVKNPDYIRNLLYKPYPKGNIPDEAVCGLTDYITSRSLYYHNSAHSLIDDYEKLRAMQHITKSNGILFKWFHWDFSGIQMEKSYQDIRKYHKHHTTLLDDRICYSMASNPHEKDCWSVRQLIMESFGKTLLKEWECDCKHLNSEAHHWVADRLYEDLKTWLN